MGKTSIRWKAQVSELEARFEATDARVFDLVKKSNAELGPEIAKQQRIVADAKRDADFIERSRRYALGHYAPVALLAPRFDELASILDDLCQKGEFPRDFTEGVLRDLCNEEKCICGRGLPKGSAEYAAVDKLRQSCISDVVSERLWRIKSALAEDYRDGYREQAAGLRQKLDELHTKTAELTERSARASEDLRGTGSTASS